MRHEIKYVDVDTDNVCMIPVSNSMLFSEVLQTLKRLTDEGHSAVSLYEVQDCLHCRGRGYTQTKVNIPRKKKEAKNV